MIHTLRGVVLHHIKYKESSAIVHIYTDLYGRQSYLVNSIRGKKSKHSGNLLQPLTLLELEAYHKEGRDLQRLKDIRNYIPYRSIPFDVHKSGQALFYYCKQTSGLCAYRSLLLEHYRKRVELVEKNGFSRKMGFEPGSHGRKERVDDYKAERWMSEYPNVDIRHQHNLTPSRWRQDQFRSQRNCKGWQMADEIPGWGHTKGRFDEFLKGVGG